MKVCIMGQGYIGLPTAALFSRSHCEVVGVDISEEMVNNLNGAIRKPQAPVQEPVKKDPTKNKMRFLDK